MSISAAEVKALRERTGAGMMECKKALVETDGDIDAAIELMRKSGLAKADKKAGRTAAEGRVALATEGGEAALVEVNCETDFVAGGDDFAAFADALARRVLEAAPADVEALSELELEDRTSVDTRRRELIAKLGENINVRRFERLGSRGTLGRYVHGVRIGVLVDVEGGDEALARDVAMHIAATNPVCVGPGDVPSEVLEREREIHRAQAEQSGKPPEIVEKMIEGRLRKYVNEVALTGQPFVKDPDRSVGDLLKENGAKVRNFVRFEVGEGIEKEETDFASEVMAQVQGS